MNRRNLIKLLSAFSVLLPQAVWAAEPRAGRRRKSGKKVQATGLPPEVDQAMSASGLVYLSPIKSNGDLSKCQSEVWFVRDGNDILVVSTSKSWRIKAVQQGLKLAKLWVGDYGVASKSEGRYLSLPSINATATIETSPEAQALALTLFSKKYRGAWLFWRGRFKKGLEGGSRMLVRYRLVF